MSIQTVRRRFALNCLWRGVLPQHAGEGAGVFHVGNCGHPDIRPDQQTIKRHHADGWENCMLCVPEANSTGQRHKAEAETGSLKSYLLC